jgi:ATP-binding cassette subfamily G (WHITE) protein 2
VLAGRKTAGTTTGSLLFSGSKPSRAFLRRFTGYVEQFDTLLALLTVEEMLLYTAELKRPMSEPLASKKAAVEDVLQALALTQCRDVKIGDPMNKGISGGQAKRVNIGLALVTSPRVLFLDEPTSGLDSFTANEVMTVVRGLVSDGVTICATIHSPTAYAFGLFDSLMMLTRGRVVYFGRAGAPAIEYAKIAWPQSGAKDASVVGNAAEWLTEIITKADREGGATALADTYAGSALAATNLAALEAYMAESASVALPEHLRAELAVQHETVTPWWWGLKTLVKYRTPKNYKDGDWLGARIGDKFLMTTLMWTLYWGVGRTFSVDNYVNQAAVLFMFIVLPAYGAASYVPSIVLERSLYVRERSDGLYYPITYLAAKMADELLIQTVCSVGFAAASFFAIGFQGSFGLFWLVRRSDVACALCA